MGFDYLQTDDRDDYFEQFAKKAKVNPIISFSLINPQGKMILKEVPRFKLRNFAKKNFLFPGQSGKKIWRQTLERIGYKVINNYLLIQNKEK